MANNPYDGKGGSYQVDPVDGSVDPTTTPPVITPGPTLGGRLITSNDIATPADDKPIASNADTPVSIIIPADDIGWRDGDSVTVYQAGAGTVSFAAGSGVTLRNADVTTTRYGKIVAVRVGANEWASAQIAPDVVTRSSLAGELAAMGIVTATTDPVTGGIQKITAGSKTVPVELEIAKSFTDISNTGTISETKIYSKLIPAGTIITPSSLRIVSGLKYVTSPTPGNRTIRIRLNTIDSLSGASTLCSNIMTIQSVTQGVCRTDQIVFESDSVQKGSCVGSGWNSAQGNDWATSNLSVLNDMYLIVSSQLAGVDDVFTLKSFYVGLLNG